MIIETKRCFLREMTGEDAQSFYHLNLDPEVIKYTGDDAFESVEDARVFLESYDHYEKYGFGRWAVIEKETNAFIGWCGLKYTPESDEYDIGFRFFKSLWNKGFATETALTCIEYGFNRLNLPTIVGRAMQANVGSIRVLEKCGLTFSHTINFDGEEGCVYVIRNKQ